MFDGMAYSMLCYIEQKVESISNVTKILTKLGYTLSFNASTIKCIGSFYVCKGDSR